PEPVHTLVSQIQLGPAWVTAVTRVWRPEVRYCGRCPRDQCLVLGGTCLVLVPDFVPEAEAPDLRVDGLLGRGPAAAAADGLGPGGQPAPLGLGLRLPFARDH